MEPKYVSLDDIGNGLRREQTLTVNPIDLKQAEQNERLRGGLPPHMQFYFSFPPGSWTEPTSDPIITEDIECEIVENKQLPAPK